MDRGLRPPAPPCGPLLERAASQPHQALQNVLPSQPSGDLRRAVPCQKAQHQDQAIQGLSSRPPACLRPAQRRPMRGATQGWPRSDRRRGVRRGLRPWHLRSPPGVRRGAAGRRAACASEPGKGSQVQPHAGSSSRSHVLPRECDTRGSRLEPRSTLSYPHSTHVSKACSLGRCLSIDGRGGERLLIPPSSRQCRASRRRWDFSPPPRRCRTLPGGDEWFDRDDSQDRHSGREQEDECSRRI